MSNVLLRARISPAHKQALENLESFEHLPANTLIANLIFDRARTLGVWPSVSLDETESNNGCIHCSALPIHPRLRYADLNRVSISPAEAKRRFADGQPVYVNDRRYEYEAADFQSDG